MSLTNITATLSNGIYALTAAQTKAAGVNAICQDESITLNVDNALISNNAVGTQINFLNSMIKIPNRDYALSYGTVNTDTNAQVNLTDCMVHWNLTNARKNIRFTSLVRSEVRSVKTNAAGLAFVYTQAGNQAILDSSVFDGIYVHEVSGVPSVFKNMQYKNCGINLLNWEAGDLTVRDVVFGSGTLVGTAYTGADGVAGYTTYDAWLGGGNANNKFRFIDSTINLSKIAINLTPAAGAELCFKSFTRYEKFALDGVTLSGANVQFTPSASSGVSSQVGFNRSVNSNGFLTDGVTEYQGTELLVQSTVDSGTTRASGLTDPATIRNYTLRNITWTRRLRRADILEAVLDVTPTVKIGSPSDPSDVGHVRDPNFTGTYSQAAAITGVGFIYNAGTGKVAVTLTEARTTQEIYNAWKHWTSQIAQFGISQSKITIVNGILVINGTLTVQNPGVLTGIYTDSSGTREEIDIQISQPGTRLRVTNNLGAEQYNAVVPGSSIQLYYPPGSTGTWHARFELYGYVPCILSIDVTNGGVDNAIAVMVPDSTIVDTYANVSAYTSLATTQQVRDWAAYYNQTLEGIRSPVDASLASDILFLTNIDLEEPGAALSFNAGKLSTGSPTLTGDLYINGTVMGEVIGDIYHGTVVRSVTGIWNPSIHDVTIRLTAVGTYDLRTANITGKLTLVNASGGNVIVQPPPTTIVVNTGPNITLDYKERMTIASADGLGLSSLIMINGTIYGGNPISGWAYNQTERYLDVNSNDNIMVYVHCYGYKPKLVSGMGNFAGVNNITMLPESITPSVDTATRDMLSTHFSAGIDPQGGVYLAVNMDMSHYAPEIVLDALHYYLVKLGYMAAAGALVSGTVDIYKFIVGGLILRSNKFYGKIADSITVLPDTGIYLPIYVEVDPEVAALYPTFKPVQKNASGLLLSYALWTKQAAALSMDDRTSTADLVHSKLLDDIGGIQTGASIAEIRADLTLIEERLIQTLG